MGLPSATSFSILSISLIDRSSGLNPKYIDFPAVNVPLCKPYIHNVKEYRLPDSLSLL